MKNPEHKMTLANLNGGPKHSVKTHNFIATVMWDGERVFKASNRGEGKPNEYFPYRGQSQISFEEIFKQVADECITYVKLFDSDFYAAASKQTGYGNLCVEYTINQLMNDHFIKEHMKQTMNNNIILLDEQQRIFEIKLRNIDQNKEFIKRKILRGDYPEFQILNDLDEEAQLKIWRSASD